MIEVSTSPLHGERHGAVPCWSTIIHIGLKMKKIVGFIVSWSLYLIGDLVSKLLYFDALVSVAFPVYDRFMLWSLLVQEWGGNVSPWAPAELNDDEDDDDIPF